MHKLGAKISAANKAGRKAVIPFLTAGFPNPDDFWRHLTEIDAAGADIIEIGVPFSDPVADGPVVEAASRRALEAGINLQWILDGLAQRKQDFQAPIVLMGYYNPFLQYGLEKLADSAANAGVAGMIIPDLPLEEAAQAKKALQARGISLIPLVGPNTSFARMRQYAKDAQGYVYVVSVMGVTGERKSLAASVAETLARARQAFAIPVALGFGLRHPSQLEILPCQPDAAVIGSALLKHLDAGKKAEDFLAPWL